MYPRCILWLVAFVCWSLRRLCERVESHGRRSLLRPSTYTPLPRGGLCVRACDHRRQQHQHQTIIIPSAVASSPCIRALALARSSGQTLCACSRQDVFCFQFRAQVVVLHEQYHPVRKCNGMLIIILKPTLLLHFRA